MRFLAELQRRNVLRMAGWYLVAAWLVVQVAGTVLPMFEVPAWVLRAIVMVLAVCFVPALVLSWLFEWTPEGIKREDERATGPAETTAPTPVRPRDRLLLAGLVVVLTVIAVDALWPALPPRVNLAGATLPASDAPAVPDAAPAPNSIAVLPFVNMSSDPEQDYFSDGLSEELLNQLAQLPQLQVIARTSSFAFKGKEVGITTIARTLGVAHVLEGSVRKSGTRLRITAQLIRAADSTRLWSHTYKRELTDVFAIQEEIAAAVVAGLKIQLLPRPAPAHGRSTRHAGAYDQYLLGQNALNFGEIARYEAARAAFTQAIALDPDYAEAYVGLATSEVFLADESADPGGLQRAIKAVDRALDLAPDLAEAYGQRGWIRTTCLWDYPGGREDLEHALALAPDNSKVLFRYASMQASLNQLPAATQTATRALNLDPLSSEALAFSASYLTAQQQYGAARDLLERALAVSPNSEFTLQFMGQNELLDGHTDAALAAFQRTGPGFRLFGEAIVKYSMGKTKASKKALDALSANHALGYAYQIAEAYAWRGETDLAFEWLDRAYAQRDGGLALLQYDPLLRRLRDDARYAALVRRVGFAPRSDAAVD